MHQVKFMKTKIISLCLLSMALAACEEQTKTVDYYQRHREEMTTKLKDCRNDPGRLGRTTNCLNANTAEFRGSIFDSPSPQTN